ncbi:hypothetical protein PBF_12912 [Cytobacillus firmus DS1]|uniref:Uncharacterized protein n=1 Tax=Cytobacillus firmus DS1 TaxID=1307436 RepID=W7L661_CYTFI|nr:hypothetical protein PBF_12912 [Cytobacillus firmus DS1]
MTPILPKAFAFGRAMIMLTKPSLSWGPQAQDEPPGKAFFAFLGGLPEMWRLLPFQGTQTKNATSCGNVCMTPILPKAFAFGRAMIMLTKPSLS